MRDGGIPLSSDDLKNLTRAAEILHDPFGFGTLDGWRQTVNNAIKKIVQADVAVFYVHPSEHREGGPVFTEDLSQDQCADFVREALFDAGTDRALAFGLTIVTQRGIVRDDWDGYFADPSVNRFYLPNHLRDCVGFMVWDRDGRKEASLECYHSRFGSPWCGDEGAALLSLLLPAFRAGVAAVRVAEGTQRGVEALLDAVGAAIAIADARGRITFKSQALLSLLAADPEGGAVDIALSRLVESHAALFEARGWGRRHRTALPSLEAALAATTSARTGAGQYQLSVVEAPAALNCGRHGFLLRVEATFAATLSPADARARFALSTRELHVARLLAAGTDNAHIAAALGISPHTARRHTEKVLKKLGVTSRAGVGHALTREPPHHGPY